MRILDLFCGAGGASMGYHRAFPDAQIVGVDIDRAPLRHYPFQAVQGDAMNPPVNLDSFDLIHASPPCQEYSVTARLHDVTYPKLVAPIREMLQNYTYVIENVEGSDVANHPTLDGRFGTQACGTMFGLNVRRHRWFETSFPVSHGWCNHQNLPVARPESAYWSSRHREQVRQERGPVTAAFRTDLGLEWMTIQAASESFPTEYTQWIGDQYGG